MGGGLSLETVGTPMSRQSEQLSESQNGKRQKRKGTVVHKGIGQIRLKGLHQPCQFFVIESKQNILKGPFSKEFIEIVEGIKVCVFKENFVLQTMLPDCKRVRSSTGAVKPKDDVFTADYKEVCQANFLCTAASSTRDQGPVDVKGQLQVREKTGQDAV